MDKKNDIKIYLGEVKKIVDDYEGGRIIARIDSADMDKQQKDEKLPYCTPLLPLMFHARPKVGEAVYVFVNTKTEQRFYIGPVIAQPQFMYKQNYLTANRLETGGIGGATKLSNYTDSQGTMPNHDDIAIMGRDKCEIIMSDNDIRIRCGVRMRHKKEEVSKRTNAFDRDVFVQNRTDPAYIKLAYHTTPITVSKAYKTTSYDSTQMYDTAINSADTRTDSIKSTATIVAQEINLISNASDDWFETSEKDGSGISNATMKEIIEKAHSIPYGDVLVDFLQIFKKAFVQHVHPYGPMPPVYDANVARLDGFDFSSILSKNVRIN